MFVMLFQSVMDFRPKWGNRLSVLKMYKFLNIWHLIR